MVKYNKSAENVLDLKFRLSYFTQKKAQLQSVYSADALDFVSHFNQTSDQPNFGILAHLAKNWSSSRLVSSFLEMMTPGLAM